jgi:hypothetical protein
MKRSVSIVVTSKQENPGGDSSRASLPFSARDALTVNKQKSCQTAIPYKSGHISMPFRWSALLLSSKILPGNKQGIEGPPVTAFHHPSHP